MILKNNRRPRGYFDNKENIIKEIKLRHDNGLKLNNKIVTQEDGGLISAAKKHFSNWENAVVLAGIDYNLVQESKKWSKSRITEALLERYYQGLSLNSSILKKENLPLYKACVNHFRTIKLAIESCGLDYEDIKLYGTWSKEKVLKNLLTRYKNGFSMSVIVVT